MDARHCFCVVATSILAARTVPSFFCRPELLDSFSPSSFEHTMSMVARVVEGEEREQGERTSVDRGTLSAWCGSTVRGVSSTPLLVPFGPFANHSLFHLLLYSDHQGDEIRFQFERGDAAAATTTWKPVDQSVLFSVDGSVGSAVDPLLLTFQQ